MHRFKGMLRLPQAFAVLLALALPIEPVASASTVADTVSVQAGKAINAREGRLQQIDMNRQE